MNTDHKPDPGFVDHLEWELKSTIRRQASFDTTSRTLWPFRLRSGAALALVAVSMLIGGAGAHAVSRSIDSRTAALYVARGESLLEIARMQLEPIAQELSTLKALVEQGATTEREANRVELQYVQAESEIRIRELELAETILTGKEPADSLSAPLVGQRDFVTERMEERRLPMRWRLNQMLDQADHVQGLIDAGVASITELITSRSQVRSAEKELNSLENRIELRKAYLAGELSAVEVELRGMRVAAIVARETAVGRIEVLVEQHKQITRLSDRGVVSDAEARAVEAELRAVEGQVDLADMELSILDQKLQEVSGK